jgi:hypothetical protein
MNSPTYLHVLDGRIRIKIPAIKGSAMRAAEVAEGLLHVQGITHVKANHLTGNVLILFNADTVTSEHILGLLRRRGSPARVKKTALRPPTGSIAKPTPQLYDWRKAVLGLLIQTLMEAAFSRLIFVLA